MPKKQQSATPPQAVVPEVDAPQAATTEATTPETASAEMSLLFFSPSLEKS